MSFMNVPTAHLPNPLKGGCQRKMKGSQAEQRERHLSFCSSFAFEEIKTEEKRDFFYFVLPFLYSSYWDVVSGVGQSQHLSALYSMQDSKLDELLHKDLQILSKCFPPSSKSHQDTQAYGCMFAGVCKNSLRLLA